MTSGATSELSPGRWDGTAARARPALPQQGLPQQEDGNAALPPRPRSDLNDRLQLLVRSAIYAHGMARRLHLPLSEWSAADVLALINDRVEEGQRLEYKRELDLDEKKQRKEAAKDASGLANAQGGLLVYGVGEQELADGRRLPTEPVPLTDGGAQARLEDVLDSAVTPALNFEARQAETEGGFFLIVRVFQRSGGPHMVDAYDEKRCYVRVGLKTRPMEHHELEGAYRSASLGEDRALKRLALVPICPRLEAVEAGAECGGGPGVWASLIVLPLDASDLLLDARKAHPLQFPDDGEHQRWDRSGVLWGGLSYDAHGYFNETTTDSVLMRRVRLYRNGVCEWGYRYDHPEDQGVPSIAFAMQVHDALAYFATVYRRAGYYGRIRVWVSLENTVGTELLVSPNYIWFRERTLDVPRIEWSSTENVERLLDDVTPVVHAAMDRFWLAYGFERCLLFTEDGQFREAR